MRHSVQLGLVSTIIPVFNRPKMIVESVNSVLEQTYRPIEIIIVDDGSTDETPTVLKSLAKQHPEIRVLTQINSGPGAARETGRQKALGEFIQYHDSDDLLCTEKFKHQVAALLANPEADVAYGKTERRILSEPLKEIALKGTGDERPAMFPDSLRSRWWSTSTPLYRRSVTDQAGAWLTTSNEEDWEYDCRVASLGGRLVFVDQFVSITQVHDDHLHYSGTVDPSKLRDRCAAKTAMAKHAKAYMTLRNRATDIEKEDWQFFSKTVFLLARECAAADLRGLSEEMTALSIEAIGRNTFQHRVFSMLTLILGYKGAARLLKFLGK